MKQFKILKDIASFLLFAILFTTCKEPTTLIDPSPKEDIVPQTDIPWSSLADTPWPMHHHDPQSTGRSNYSGPQNGIISKKVYVGMSVSGIFNWL